MPVQYDETTSICILLASVDMRWLRLAQRIQTLPHQMNRLRCAGEEGKHCSRSYTKVCELRKQFVN